MTKLQNPLVVAAIVVVCLAMSAVQFWRADIKNKGHRARQDALAAQPIELTRHHQTLADIPTPKVAVQGTWEPERTMLLDNRTLDGRVGYHVVTPLRLPDGATVLVNRGWIPAPPLRSQLPVLPNLAAGPQLAQFEAWATEFDAPGLQMGDGRPQGIVWPYLRMATYRAQTGQSPLEVLLLQLEPAANPGAELHDGLIRPWTTPQSSNPAIKHIGYAIMWLFFSVLAIINARLSSKSEPAHAKHS